MGLKETLRKAAGLLIEMPPETHPEQTASTVSSSELDGLLADLAGQGSGSTKTVEQVVRDTDGPNLDQITVVAATAPPAMASDGKLDLQAIYGSAGLAPSPFSAEQMLEMLSSLPAELPLETKRRTVRVTLDSLGKSMGATPETIVADATRKLTALQAYAEATSTQTQQFVAAAEGEIAAFTAQIEERRKAIQDAKLKQMQVVQSCDTESDRLDDILEFFSLDVHPSKYADPPAKV